jgi:hypothetical protein
MGRRSSKRFRTSTVAIKESEDQPEEEVDEEVVENDKSEEIQPEEEGQEEGEYEIGESHPDTRLQAPLTEWCI